MNAYKACAWVVFSQYFWHAFRYSPADFSLLTITLSQQSVSKCLLLPWGRLHNWTSFLELPSCKVYSHSLRVGCHAQGAAASLMWWVWIDVCIKTDVLFSACLTKTVNQWVVRHLPVAGFSRLNRLVWPSWTDARQCDALWWLLLFSSAQGSVEVYGPFLLHIKKLPIKN